jgi:transcriptional regulator of acetoin/glycerol metabolism
MSYSWPGNVRELEHTLEHATIVCQKGVITREDLPEDILKYAESANGVPRLGKQQAKYLDGDERGAIIEALTKTGWNKSKAARLLGISRRTIYRRIEQLGIEDSIPDT